jgi:hypothetical protein
MYYDVFFLTAPKQEIHCTKPEAFYALAEVRSPGGTYWHAQLTKEQYDYRVKAKLVCRQFSELDTKFSKEVASDGAKKKRMPVHTFGGTMRDEKTQTRIVPEIGKADISMTAVAAPIGVAEVEEKP